MNLKILHLLSNWKWTEISEPAVELALAQAQLNATIEFVCGRDPVKGSKFGVEYHAGLKGLKKIHVLNMPKHLRIAPAFSDFMSLRPVLKRLQPDVLHCHNSNAHLLGLLIRGTTKPPIIVYSCYDPQGLPSKKRSRFLYRFGTDGLVVINEKSRQVAMSNYAFTSDMVQIAEPGIDLIRFSPRRKINEDINGFGLKPGSFVIGAVTRIRGSRRLDIPIKAICALANDYPQLQMLLVGRGNRSAIEEIVEKPAQELKISDRIVRAGYCEGDRLVAAYRAMDVLVYPNPGTDKSCRTVREAMAAGVPVIASRIGFLPELIPDRIAGRLMDGSWQSLAKIIKEYIEDQETLREMGRRSLETAEKRFSPLLQAERTLNFYAKLLKS
jgi:glycosyltransferase involved in cell wall biosynthesis